MLVFLFDEFLIYVGVDLRGADVGMAEKFLQYAEIHAGFETVGGETVPEGVRRNLLC